MNLPAWMLARLQADPQILGALLYGSRALDMADPDSDYDLLVVTLHPPKEAHLGWRENDDRAELQLRSLSDFQAMPRNWSWWSFGFANAQIVYDPRGVMVAGLAALQQPPEAYLKAVPELLDSYLNSTYRGLKAWRRGDELGARLHLGQGLPVLLDALFRAAGQWTPYWDRLESGWNTLRLPGLDTELLRERLRVVAQRPDVAAQRALFVQVAAWMRRSGYAQVVDSWDEGFHSTMNDEA